MSVLGRFQPTDSIGLELFSQHFEVMTFRFFIIKQLRNCSTAKRRCKSQGGTAHLASLYLANLLHTQKTVLACKKRFHLSLQGSGTDHQHHSACIKVSREKFVP